MKALDIHGCTVELEYSDKFIAIHLPRVEKFSKTLYATMQEYAEELDDFVKTVGFQNLYAAIKPEDELTIKLAERLGFNFLAQNDGLNVYVYGEFLQWDQH